jgi:glycosyltransferase involved in cell wall biosynthesis
MKIGIVPGSKSGGVHQYTATMLWALEQRMADGGDEFLAFVEETHHSHAAGLRRRGWATMPVHPPSLQRRRRVVRELRRVAGEGRLRGGLRWLKHRFAHVPGNGNAIVPDLNVVRHRSDVSRWLRRSGVELMLYPSPTSFAFEVGIPYVMAIHDLQHRLQPEFPEVSANGEWESREYCFRNGARYATCLLADSEVGREDILNFYSEYGVTPEQVRVLPFLPASHLAVEVTPEERHRLRAAYQLPERYVFYPAQFWPHKNHAGIIRALSLLKEEHRLEVPVVFCGAYASEIRHRTFLSVMELAHRLKLHDQIRYVGYVPDEDMSGLYAGAEALVMPTFFGPTNIPVLEAWAFGCPVVTSDIRGIREQAGDAAILVDPGSEEAIADAIRRLWTDATLRQTLAGRGRQRLASYGPDDYVRRLTAILEDAKERVRSVERASLLSS